MAALTCPPENRPDCLGIGPTLGRYKLSETVGLPRIDYLAINAGRRALQVLHTVDWDKGPPIDFVGVEGDALDAAGPLRDLLHARGYVLLALHGASLLFRLRPAPTSQTTCHDSMWIDSGDDKGNRLSVPWETFAEACRHFAGVQLEQQAGKVTLEKKAQAMFIANIADREAHETKCPIAMLTARLSIEIARVLVGNGRDALRHSLRTNRGFLSEEQALRAGLTVEGEGSEHKWRDCAAVPKLWLADFDFFEALHGDWPVFEVLDTLCRYLQATASTDEAAADTAMATASGAPLLVGTLLARGFVDEAQAFLGRALAAASREEGIDAAAVRAAVLGLELLVKDASLALGVLWVVEHSGESPNIWGGLAKLSRLLRLSGPPAGPAPAPAGVLDAAWAQWYERRLYTPRPSFRRHVPMTVHRNAGRPFAMCLPAKNGSSRWLMLLRRVEGFKDYLEYPNFVDTNGLRYLFREPVSYQREFWTGKEHFKVFIARNPLVRALSAYLEKKHEYQLPSSFERFVSQHLRPDKRNIIGEPVLGDNHWWPQTELCESPAEVHYDFIAHVETRSQWMPKLFDLLGIEEAAASGWGKDGSGSFSEAAGISRETQAHNLTKLAAHYTGAAFTHAACFYQRDIELLGYEEEVASLFSKLYPLKPPMPPVSAFCESGYPLPQGEVDFSKAQPAAAIL